MPNLRGSEWLIIILLLVLLFGAKRLPDAARSMGRSLRIFKAETKGLVDENPPPVSPPTAAASATSAPLAPPTPVATPIAPPTPGSPPAPPSAPEAESPTGGALTPQPPAQA